MKCIIIGCITGLWSIIVLHSQPYLPLHACNGDTQLYITTNFIDNQQKYIGATLGQFLEDFELPIGNAFLVGLNSFSDPVGKCYVEGIHIYYQTMDETTGLLRYSRKNSPLIIYFSAPEESYDRLEYSTAGVENEGSSLLEYAEEFIVREIILNGK